MSELSKTSVSQFFDEKRVGYFFGINAPRGGGPKLMDVFINHEEFQNEINAEKVQYVRVKLYIKPPKQIPLGLTLVDEFNVSFSRPALKKQNISFFSLRYPSDSYVFYQEAVKVYWEQNPHAAKFMRDYHLQKAAKYGND